MEPEHILGNNLNWEDLCNWLDQREVCFDLDGHIFSSPELMLECFQVLHYVDGLVFWKLYPDAVKKGMFDPSEVFLDFRLEDDEVGLFMVYGEDYEQIDVVDQWKVIKYGWWNNNKHRQDIRQRCIMY